MAITKTKATSRCHIKLVISDPDFIREFDEIEKISMEDLYLGRRLNHELLSMYGLQLDDFSGDPNNGLMIFMNPDMMFYGGRLEYISKNQEFIATFSSSIRKDQFMELWELIQKNKVKKQNSDRSR